MRPIAKSYCSVFFSCVLIIMSIAQPVAAQDVGQATPIADESEMPTELATETPTAVETEPPVARASFGAGYQHPGFGGGSSGYVAELGVDSGSSDG